MRGVAYLLLRQGEANKIHQAGNDCGGNLRRLRGALRGASLHQYELQEDPIFETYRDRILVYNGSLLITDYKQIFNVAS